MLPAPLPAPTWATCARTGAVCTAAPAHLRPPGFGARTTTRYRTGRPTHRLLALDRTADPPPKRAPASAAQCQRQGRVLHGERTSRVGPRTTPRGKHVDHV